MQDTRSFAVGGIRHGKSNEIYGSVVEISETKKASEIIPTKNKSVSAGESAISD